MSDVPIKGLRRGCPAALPLLLNEGVEQRGGVAAVAMLLSCAVPVDLPGLVVLRGK